MLTEREMEILLLIAKGYSNQEIASASHITIKTVKTHVSNILSKLEVQDRTQAVIYAFLHSYNSGVEYAKKHAKDVKVHQFNGPVKMMVKFLFLYSVQIKHKVDNQEQILSWLFNMTLSIKNENDVCHA